jgi:hypothetical protein
VERCISILKKRDYKRKDKIASVGENAPDANDHGGKLLRRTGKRGVGAVSASPLGSVVSQVNSAPGSFLPFLAPKRDMVCGRIKKD